MLCNFLRLNSDKTEVLLLWPQAARRKLSDYIITLDGLSVTSRSAVTETKSVISVSVSQGFLLTSCQDFFFFYVTVAFGLLIRDLDLDPDFCKGIHMHTLTHHG